LNACDPLKKIPKDTLPAEAVLRVAAAKLFAFSTSPQTTHSLQDVCNSIPWFTVKNVYEMQ
jgi:hypothetical protein